MILFSFFQFISAHLHHVYPLVHIEGLRLKFKSRLSDPKSSSDQLQTYSALPTSHTNVLLS
jgi:hypothetical protein